MTGEWIPSSERLPPDKTVVLVRAATLTDEEREVLVRVADDASYRALAHTERVVRGILERLG